jgi:hypothetical protein
MTQPQEFEKVGDTYIGYAIAVAAEGGGEMIILCPTVELAISAAARLGTPGINPAEIKRAQLGPARKAFPAGAKEKAK